MNRDMLIEMVDLEINDPSGLELYRYIEKLSVGNRLIARSLFSRIEATIERMILTCPHPREQVSDKRVFDNELREDCKACGSFRYSQNGDEMLGIGSRRKWEDWRVG